MRFPRNPWGMNTQSSFAVHKATAHSRIYSIICQDAMSTKNLQSCGHFRTLIRFARKLLSSYGSPGCRGSLLKNLKCSLGFFLEINILVLSCSSR